MISIEVSATCGPDALLEIIGLISSLESSRSTPPAAPMITAEQLRSLLHYDQETGQFRWKVSRTNRIKVGDIAGCPGVDRKYWVIRIGNRLKYGHKLAWFYMNGVYPACRVDHRDGDGLNNKFSNLRLSTNSQNSQNSKRRLDNKSGYKGVSWDKKYTKWRAQICVNKNKINIGLFADKEGAYEAYCNAAREHFGEFARTS